MSFTLAESQFRCIAHIVHLSARAFLSEADSIIDKLREIIKDVRYNLALEDFRRICDVLGVPSTYSNLFLLTEADSL